MFICFPKCLRIAPFILLYVCNLSSKSLLYSDIRYPRYIILSSLISSRSQWLCGVRRGSAAVPVLGLRIRIPPWHECLYLVSVVCCQVEASLAQKSPTECSVDECARETSKMERPWPTDGYCTAVGVGGLLHSSLLTYQLYDC